MARVKVKSPGAEINNLNEVDSSLAEIAVLKSKVDGRKAKYNEEEQKRREEVTKKNESDNLRITELELGIQSYCENNRQEFGNKKSIELTHGTVSFRTSTGAVKTLKGFTFASALNLAKVATRDLIKTFVRKKEELDKGAILAAYAFCGDKDNAEKAVSAEELKSIGVEVVKEETFGYECKMAISNN